MTFSIGYVTLATFMKGYVTLWYLSRVMSHCHICQGLCRIVMFINVDVSLWCYWGLYRITMLSHGLFINVDVSLWCYRGLYHITMLSHGLLGYVKLVTFIKGYVTLSYLSRVMSHCDVHQGLRFTVTLSRVISHYDVKPWFVTVGV